MKRNVDGRGIMHGKEEKETANQTQTNEDRSKQTAHKNSACLASPRKSKINAEALLGPGIQKQQNSKDASQRRHDWHIHSQEWRCRQI